MAAHGLPDATLAFIRGILDGCPRVEKAILYGSRAKGDHKPGSDIDLALVGRGLDFDDLSRIAGAFDESSIPYQVDVLLWDSVTDPSLRDHIERVGVVLFARNDVPAAPARRPGHVDIP